MRPVVKGTDPPYTDKTTFTFKGANAVAIRKFITPVSGQNTFRITDCLTVWLAYVKNSPLPPQATVQDRMRAKNAIENQVNALYKLAGVFLLQRIGPFCSYCEISVTGLLEVEHCVPKSNYPTFSTSWENFLLSCGACNTAKGNTPNRTLATGWTGKTNPTEQELYNEIRGTHYVWADEDSKAYDWMPVRLQYLNQTVWTELSMKLAANLDNLQGPTDPTKRTVGARIYSGPTTYNDVYVRAAVLSDTTGKTPDNATETITLCNLNGVSDTQSTYDRRMFNRTIVWFTCLTSLKNLKKAQDQQTFGILWNQMLMTASATGYYSVWLTLIAYVFPDLADNFVTDTNKDKYFPGTDVTDLP